MLDPMQFRCIQIDPFRQLTTGDKVHFSDPRGKLLDTSEPILQQAPVPVTLCTSIIDLRTLRSVLIERLLPNLIATVHPGYYKINVVHESSFLSFVFLLYSVRPDRQTNLSVRGRLQWIAPDLPILVRIGRRCMQGAEPPKD